MLRSSSEWEVSEFRKSAVGAELEPEEAGGGEGEVEGSTSNRRDSVFGVGTEGTVGCCVGVGCFCVFVGVCLLVTCCAALDETVGWEEEK